LAVLILAQPNGLFCSADFSGTKTGANFDTDFSAFPSVLKLAQTAS
jgi:hypothetical protein